LRAKNSPPRLNTTIARGPAATSRRVPGGKSASAATTWRAIDKPQSRIPDERSDIRSNSDLSIACPGVASFIRASDLIEPIERPRVLREEFGTPLLAQTRRQGEERVVEIPVRVVACKHDAVPADPVHHLDEMLGLLGLLHRLGRDPDVLAHVLRWRLAQVR